MSNLKSEMKLPNPLPGDLNRLSVSGIFSSCELCTSRLSVVPRSVRKFKVYMWK